VVIAADWSGDHWQSGEREPLYGYSIVLRPWLWMLTQTSNNRIFQNKTVLEVIDDVLKKISPDFELKPPENYKTLEYCVQYSETDFDFVSRSYGRVWVILLFQAFKHKTHYGYLRFKICSFCRNGLLAGAGSGTSRMKCRRMSRPFRPGPRIGCSGPGRSWSTVSTLPLRPKSSFNRAGKSRSGQIQAR